MNLKVKVTLFFTFCFSFLIFNFAFSYPSTIQKTLSLGINQGSDGFDITNDNKYLIIGNAKTVKLVDLGTFDLATNQPYDITQSTSTDYNIGGLVYVNSGNYIYATQENGNLLRFSMDAITSTPSTITIESGKQLSMIADATIGSSVYLYILDDTNSTIYIYQPSTGQQTKVDLKQTSIPPTTLFHVLDMGFNEDTEELYLSTDVGWLIYMSYNGQIVASIDIASTNGDDLTGIEANSDGSIIYTVDGTTSTVYLVSTVTHLKTGTPIDLSEYNSKLKYITAAAIQGTNDYIYISGQNGISILDSASDLETTTSPIDTSDSGPMVSSSDYYIYMTTQAGNIDVLSDNPDVTVSTVVYKDSTGAVTTALKQGGTVEITFSSATAGTYVVKANGDITGSGSTLTDTNGSTSGSISAGESKQLTFAYNTNSSILNEGTNIFYFFVTDSSSRKGRFGEPITVDLPPGAITISGTGFGNTKAYLTFSRLTPSDISYYKIYADTVYENVKTKTEVAATVSQPASGGTVTGIVNGLTNGTTYYLAVEGVDTGGLVGPRAYGETVKAAPQQTLSLTEMSGENGGCNLTASEKSKVKSEKYILLIFIPIFVFFFIKRKKALFVLMFFLIVPSISNAALKKERWWSTEVKVGFWMPTNSTTKQFISKCCNILPQINGGFLYKGRYGAEFGIGVLDKSEYAIGADGGGVSSDKFNLLLIPMETNGVWRIDYVPDQIVVPYIKAGVDYVFYRESFQGVVTMGLKSGLHANGGLQFLLKKFDADNAMKDAGITDFYAVIEARYGWVNSFGKKGLDLSGVTYSVGLLFEF